MSNYDFTSLSSYDFEGLVRDLLQEELKVTLESFTSGRDKGIDLRYSSAPSGSVIVQCKHYINSGFRSLFNHLKIHELPKIHKLTPQRYILATSVRLTPDNKEKLIKLLSPHCISTGDIYGKDDLNNLLGKFPNIEKRNFKLWLTSKSVMDQIIHSSLYNRSNIELENIKNKIKIYVQNQSYFDAKKILEDQHYCIISGIPGIGKTTLAEILLVDYLAHGYEIIQISGDIEEAFTFYVQSKKQIFYYDDFLGQTGLSEKLNKNEDKRLLQFVDTVHKMGSSRFILTTREYILNQAKTVYERLTHSSFDYRKCIIDLSSFTKLNKAKILFNHIYFSKLPETAKIDICKDFNYLKIIQHRNYSPRIVEWMTDISKFPNENDQSYIDLFLSNLNDPSRLWSHAFLNQLSNSSRHLLIALASLPDKVLIEDLENAFISFHTLMAKNNNSSIESLDFKNSLEELESNFIKIESTKDETLIQFHNPSIRDFLNIYLQTNATMARTLCKSIVFFDQCQKLWKTNTSIAKKAQNITNFPAENIAIKFPIEFWQAMANTFESTTVQLINEHNFSNNLTYKRRADQSLEIRLVFALEIARIMPIVDTNQIIQQMVEITTRNIFKGNSNKWDLFNLFNWLNELEDKYHISYDQIIHGSKNILINNNNSFSDYEYIIKFQNRFPNVLATDEYYQIVNDFNNWYSFEVESLISNINTPDEISSEIRSLTEIGTSFGIDVTDGVCRLNEYENELLENGGLDEDSRNDLWMEEAKEKELEEKEVDKEILSIFQTLL